MLGQPDETHTCSDCGEEFTVTSSYDAEPVISFCPFCGAEMEEEDEDDDISEEFRDEW